MNNKYIIKKIVVVALPILLCSCLLSIKCKKEEDSNNIDRRIHVLKFQTAATQSIIWNVADNMNQWDYSQWLNDMGNVPEDYFRQNMPYVKYIQLMTVAGGNRQRDLFKDPLDRTVMDDYDFSPLIGACKNILRQGLTPHLKLGNVPLKYSANPKIGVFGVNKCPPDDYHLWHTYIKALIQSLTKEFGLETVCNWRFGVVTEYENNDWFSVDNDPVRTRDAYIMLYDYTVDALEQVLGNNICVGAHSMTVTEGLWDERELIVHCARGKNLCTGKTGTRLSFLSASYYDDRPGVMGNRKSLSETISFLRDMAEKEGFNNLFYGIDEGRMLTGLDKKDLYPRAAGYSWQAAYDARMYHTMLDENIDYFSHWAYTTSYILPGALSVSAHTSNLFHRMAGSVRLADISEASDTEEKIAGIAALNKEQNKLYALFYAYSDKPLQSGQAEISCDIAGLEKKSGKVSSIRTLISDDSNFFDEYLADREKAGITQSDYGWSSDSFVLSSQELPNPSHLQIFKDRIPYYITCSTLKPVSESLNIKEGILNIRTSIPVHGVALYEIALD